MPSDIHAALGNVCPHISYTSLELVLLPHRGLGFSLIRELSTATVYIFLALKPPKSQKYLHLSFVLFINLTNQYLQLLMGLTTFFNRKVYN